MVTLQYTTFSAKTYKNLSCFYKSIFVTWYREIKRNGEKTNQIINYQKTISNF